MRKPFLNVLTAVLFTAVSAALLITGVTYKAAAADNSYNINGFLTAPDAPVTIADPETPVLDDDVLNALNAFNSEVVNQKDSDAGVPEEVNPKAKDKDKLPDYRIKVNLKTNTVTIYRETDDNTFVPYRAMVCSIGRKGHETPEGNFKTSDYYTWRQMVDNTYGRYAVRFNHGIMFHSVPYYRTDKDSLEWQEYNKLGSPASLGCIRLAVADAKWIYDNCKRGTSVTVYSGDAKTDPLGTPEPIKIAANSKHRDWDPTDLTKENPWLVPVE